MKLLEIKVKFAETTKTRDFQNVRPELELTFNVDEEGWESCIREAIEQTRGKFEFLKQVAFTSAGGKKVSKSERWEFEEDDDIPY